MKQTLGKIITRLAGWRISQDVPADLVDRCVVLAAPHTSNWDFPLTMSSMAAVGVNLRFAIKKQWMRPPIGWFIRLLGGIGIDRTPKTKGSERPGMVDSMVALFHEHERLTMVVSPEGTRSIQTRWKTGFYYVALTAKAPIALGYLDYKKKIGGIGKIIHPSGNFEQDMVEIMTFYREIHPRFPANFALDERFSLSKIVESESLPISVPAPLTTPVHP